MSDRVAELRFKLAGRESQQPAWVSVRCAECGQTQVVAAPRNLDHMESMFPGWRLGTERPYRDYCAECLSGG